LKSFVLEKIRPPGNRTRALREEGEVARLAANRAGTTVRGFDAYSAYFTIDLQRNSAVSGVCVRSIGQYFRGKGGSKMEA